MKLALVSMPWQSPRRPSIQLGALDAFVRRERPRWTVDCHSSFADVLDHLACEEAEAMGMSGVWVGEGVFAEALLGPDPARDAFLSREAQRAFGPDGERVLERTRGAVRALGAALASVPWERYDLVGLSVAFGQTFSSLFAASLIKQRARAPVILGGPAVAGRVGQSFVDALPYVDAVVHGEGERLLVAIGDALSVGDAWQAVSPAILTRGRAPERYAGLELSTLDDLPTPRYDEYFERVARHRAAGLESQLVVETSRGCWWDRSATGPQEACTFCNLNLQWSKYREKSAPRAVAMIDELTSRYGIGELVIVDNILRQREAIVFLDGLAGLERDLWISMEARAHVGEEHFAAMRRAGVKDLQFGIEALTTPLLDRVNKGTWGLQNVRALKLSTKYGIRSQSNLITRIPNATQAEVDDQLAVIEAVSAYEPLAIAPFCLVHASPIAKDPALHAVQDVGNHPSYRKLLPPALERALFFLERDHVAQTADWRATERRLLEWSRAYRERQREGQPPALRVVERGERGATILDQRPGRARSVYSIDETAWQIACRSDDIRTFEQSAQAASVPVERVRSCVSRLVDDGLALVERDRFLFLPIIAPAAVPEELSLAT